MEDIADRVVVLEEGKVAANGTPAEILANHELLLRANLVHAHRHSHGGVSTRIRISTRTGSTSISRLLKSQKQVLVGLKASSG